jgi:TPR repeat protein
MRSIAVFSLAFFLCACAHKEQLTHLNQSLAVLPAQIPILEEKAARGDAKAALQLADHYEFVEMKFDQSLRWYRRAAELGDPIGQFNLAQLLWHDGKTTEAARYYELAAKQGHELAKEKVREMKKEPNQLPEPMSGLAPGHGSS